MVYFWVSHVKTGLKYPMDTLKNAHEQAQIRGNLTGKWICDLVRMSLSDTQLVVTSFRNWHTDPESSSSV